jgi:hypothetical protein
MSGPESDCIVGELQLVELLGTGSGPLLSNTPFPNTQLNAPVGLHTRVFVSDKSETHSVLSVCWKSAHSADPVSCGSDEPCPSHTKRMAEHELIAV